MKRSALFLLMFLFAASSGLSQQKTHTVVVKKNYPSALSGTLLLGVDLGATIGRTDYANIRPDIMGRTDLEYFFPSSSSGLLGIKGFVSGGYVSGQDDYKTPRIFRTNLFNMGGGLTYTFAIHNSVFPYVFAGVSFLHFDPKNADNVRLPGNAAHLYKRNEINYHGEIGMHFLLTDAISLNLGVAGQFSPNDNWDDRVGGGNNDMLFAGMLGISYSFFTNNDHDGDGVPDDIDQCPDTPPGVKVDEFGCPLDQDGDGVPDYKDKCPNTPKGVKVDSNGCPLDSDHDGVPDYKDKCPNTGPGLRVDSNGCPDSDGDGVPDNIDKCPDTPPGVRVDKTGCPLDSDGDGVPDYKDKCPNTPKGQQVDSVGCATKKVVKVIKKLVLNGDTNFEFDKADLLPNAYKLLQPLINTMKEDTTLRFKVAGYTDAIGSASYNLDLSRRRAQSVVDYLVSQGIDRGRFNIVPMGESNPIATNKTAEGRAMNRRVEITAIGK